MPWLLDGLYLLVLLALSPWLLYRAVRTRRYRRGLADKLLGLGQPRSLSDRPVWFHGVSVGEIHLLRTVVAAFRRRYPDRPCVVSTTTETGYDEAVRCFPDLPVRFFPFDFSWAVRRSLQAIDPALVVLAEGELWPNFLLAARRRSVPVAVINGRMSPRSFARYRRLAGLARRLLSIPDLLAVQTTDHADHLRRLGAPAERVRVTGSVKYDGAGTDRANPRTREMARLLGVTDGDLVWVCGSTQAPEEEIAVGIYRHLRERHPNLRLFLVPRQKDRFDEVAHLLERAGVPFVRRSTLAGAVAPVVLIDTIGELSAVWGLADVAFVGGSLDGQRGGQNMIEPAAYGVPVLFGPHVWNFREPAARLIDCGAARQVSDGPALEDALGRLTGDADLRRRMGEAGQAFVRAQQGATERTVALLGEVLAGRGREQRAA